MPPDLNNNEALKLAFNELGNTLAFLHRKAGAEAVKHDADPREIASIISGLIAGLRTIFPATHDDVHPPWEQIGAIAEREVIQPLRERMAAAAKQSTEN